MLSDKPDTPFLEVGFRPFFLGAGLFAMLSMALWSAIYLFELPINLENISQFEWHAHEMIFGYAIAVISGFLLTSVRTWTRLPTAQGKSLMFLLLLWAAARFLFLFGTKYILFAALFDIIFTLSLSYILTHRIIKTKKWLQLGIIANVLLITTCNILFYLGVFGYLEQGVTWGVYGGLYIIITLILVMGRRVIPFFIERATNDTALLFNTKWIDISSLLFFFMFVINELFFADAVLSAYTALLMFIINSIRLIGWHNPIIWKQGLLWSIYLAFWMITLGFLLLALPYFTEGYIDIPKLIAVHAFTVGGIAVLTLGIMSRVSLAHTGRNVYAPFNSET